MEKIFERIAASQPGEGGVYPEPGVYPILYVDTIKIAQSRTGSDLFIVDFDIIKSEVELRPAGSSMNWLADLTKDAGPGNVKKFISALAGIPSEEVTAEMVEEICSEENPAHGRLVRCEARIWKNKSGEAVITKRGQAYTICNWFPVPDPIQEKAEVLHAEAFVPF